MAQTPTTDRWQQQIHKGCGGEIVMIVKLIDHKVAACCKKCTRRWEMGTMPDSQWPNDWESPSWLVLPVGARGPF